MVYWGCGTAQNRCMWGVLAGCAVTGGLLVLGGAAKIDVCGKLPVYVHVAGACEAGPVAMIVIGAFVMLGCLPSLLYFSGCAKAPRKTEYCADAVPSSGITVVRQTASGPQVFQYDAAGKLLAAPNCEAAAAKAGSYVLSIKTKPASPAPADHSPASSPRLARLRALEGSGDTPMAMVFVSAVAAPRAPSLAQGAPLGPMSFALTAAGRAPDVDQQQLLELRQQLQWQNERRRMQQEDLGDDAV